MGTANHREGLNWPISTGKGLGGGRDPTPASLLVVKVTSHPGASVSPSGNLQLRIASLTARVQGSDKAHGTRPGA